MKLFPLPAALRQTSLLNLAAADFIVRSGYQMGKTPLLPILAASLGATDLLLGIIVSVSTLTGILLKPIVGLLSDRGGRRTWLMIGTCFFTFMPFMYALIETPQQLVIVRIVHGLATAIYGPVTLAYIAGQSKQHLAEKFGWFGLAREGGYVVGPAAAGWLLLSLSPQAVFTVVGLISSLAFIPILSLPEIKPDKKGLLNRRLQLAAAFQALRQSTSIWLSGGLEAVNFMVLYALKAFLPIYALSANVSVAVVGTFFALQEMVDILLRPLSGRLSDRIGHLSAVVIGMVTLSAGVLLAVSVQASGLLFLSALVIGVAQALIFPALIALVSQEVSEAGLGFSLGLVGSLSNVGKVAGPTLVGFMIGQFEYQMSFKVLCSALLLTALLLGSASVAKAKHKFIVVPDRTDAS